MREIFLEKQWSRFLDTKYLVLILHKSEMLLCEGQTNIYWKKKYVAILLQDTHHMDSIFKQIDFWAGVYLVMLFIVSGLQVFILRELFEEKSFFEQCSPGWGRFCCQQFSAWFVLWLRRFQESRHLSAFGSWSHRQCHQGVRRFCCWLDYVQPARWMWWINESWAIDWWLVDSKRLVS